MRTCVVLGLSAALCAGEGDAVQVGLADGAQLEAHWNASPFGKVWAEAGLVPLRNRVDQWLAEARRASGVDLAAAARAARGIQLRLVGPDARREPRWALQADLGMQAPQAARRLAAVEGSALPLVVAGADEAWSLSGRTLARFGGIVAFGRPTDLLPLPPATRDGDVAVEIDITGALNLVRSTLEPAQAAQAKPFLDLLAARWRTLAMRASLDGDGVAWSGRLDGDTAGLQPADRALLARLPANASTVQLIGIDGKAWWTGWQDGVVAALDTQDDDIRAGLAILGIKRSDLPALIQGCSGTIAIVQTPGAPIPGLSIAVPRSAAMDALVASVCARLGCRQPEEGGYALLSIPDLPVAIQLARDRGHWLLSTDMLFASTWGAGAPGGFDAAPMGRELLATAPAGACIIGANDIAPALRMALGPINMGLAMVREMTPAERQAVMIGVSRLATVLRPGYHWGVARPGRLDLQGHGGDVLWVALPAVIAAVTIPNLLENRVVANEAAVAATLKSGIFPAQVQFQAGCYQDADGDHVGEYGLVSELSGRRATGRLGVDGLRLVVGALAQGDVTNGYHVAGFLPDGQGGAVGEPDAAGVRPAVPNADAQEKFWVVYAWPVSTETGRQAFAIEQTGQVYVQPWDGSVPAWNALYDGGTWGDKPAWQLYQRRPVRRVP